MHVAEERTESAGVREKERSTMWKTHKVLIVEDEPRLRKCFSKEFREEGLSVIEASDGEEALEILYGSEKIALVILDILLPEKSALDIYDQIRKEFPHVNIVISSNYSVDEQKFLFQDADGFYNKGDSIKELVDQTSRLLGV